MKKGMIITLPKYDCVTEYISQFSLGIINEAESKNISVKQLKGVELTPEKVEKTIEQLNYKFVFFNGHGSENCIFGNKEEIIISVENCDILAGKIIYARSCDSALGLGKECIKLDSSGCFIGYTKPFQIFLNSRYEVNPLKDNVARLFLEPSNLVPLSILKGNSVFHANENSKKSILKNINKVLRKPNKDTFQIAQALWNNYDGQILLGNSKITF